MKKIYSILFFIFLTFQIQAQIDREFWFAIPNLTSAHASGPFSFVLYGYEQDATVVISQPANPTFVPITETVPANGFRIVQLAADQVTYDPLPYQVPAGEVSQRGIHIVSDYKIGVYYQIAGNNGEAYTLKGKNALGKDFLIPMQNTANNGAYAAEQPYSSIEIVATEDNTEVTIYPSNEVRSKEYGVANVNVSTVTYGPGNFPPPDTPDVWYVLTNTISGVKYYTRYENVYGMVEKCTKTPYTIVLNRGETYAVKACSQTNIRHLQNTRIRSNKPIAVNSTDDSVAHGSDKDTVGDQILPLKFAGTEYVAIYNGASYERVFIFATEDHTTVRINQPNTTTDNMIVLTSNLMIGDVQNVLLSAYCGLGNQATIPLYIESDKPIIVFQETGSGGEAGGTMLPQLTCTGSEKAVYKRIPGSQDAALTLNILVRSEFVDDFVFCGQDDVLTAAQFTEVRGNDKWLFARITGSMATMCDPISIENKTGFFHLGVIDRDAASCTYGFFSDYRSNLEMSIVGIEDTIQACVDTPLEFEVEEDIFNSVLSVVWKKGDGTVLGTGQKLTFPNIATSDEGTYILSGTSLLDCEIKDKEFYIKVNDKITETINKKLCGSETYYFGGSYLSVAGTYSHTEPSRITGCDSTTILNLEVNPNPVISFQTPDILNCLNTQAALNVSSDITTDVVYQWSTNATTTIPTIDVTAPGNYAVTVSGTSTGCSGTATVSVSKDIVKPNAVLASGGDLTCIVKTVDISVSLINTSIGSVSYDWSGGVTGSGSVVSVTGDGTYSVTVTNDGNGCSEEFDIKVNADASVPKVDFSVSDTLKCNVSQVTVTANLLTTSPGNITYDWSSGLVGTGSVATASNNGVYSLTVTDDSDGCQGIFNVEIEKDETKPQGNVTVSDVLTCDTQQVSVQVNLTTTSKQTTTYRWSNGVTGTNNYINVSTQGAYTVTVIDNWNGCSNEFSASVTSNINAPEVSIDGVQELNCFVPSITLTANPTLTGGITVDAYKWSNGSNAKTAIITEPGNYIVSVLYDNGCTNTEQVLVQQGDVVPPLVLPITGTLLVCEGTEVQLSSGPAGGVWKSSNSTLASIDPSGYVQTYSGGEATISYTVTGSNGCKNTAEAVLHIDQIPTPELPVDPVLCRGSEIRLYVSGAQSYLWSPSESLSESNSDNPIASPDETTTYHILFMNGTCVEDRDLTLEVVDSPTIEVDIDEMVNSAKATGHGGKQPYTYSLDGMDYLESDYFQRLSEGHHIMCVMDANECVGETAFYIVYLDIEIPLYFSPNGDGINDTWEIENLAMYPNATVEIFDRYGKSLAFFNGSNYAGWDGTYRGIPQPSMDYWYIINLGYEEKVYRGHFTLKR